MVSLLHVGTLKIVFVYILLQRSTCIPFTNNSCPCLLLTSVTCMYYVYVHVLVCIPLPDGGNVTWYPGLENTFLGIEVPPLPATVETSKNLVYSCGYMSDCANVHPIHVHIMPVPVVATSKCHYMHSRGLYSNIEKHHLTLCHWAPIKNPKL